MLGFFGDAFLENEFIRPSITLYVTLSAIRMYIYSVVKRIIVYYVPRRTIRVIASIVASLVISRIVCIGTYSIFCDFGADTSFYAYTRI